MEISNPILNFRLLCVSTQKLLDNVDSEICFIEGNQEDRYQTMITKTREAADSCEHSD